MAQNALTWIIREAKRLRSKDRNRKEWKQYVAQASAIYARKHKGKSPVGKPRKKAVRSRARRRVSSVRTVSRSHTDKNRITANIQVGKLGKVSAGTLTAELRRRIKERIDRAVVRKYHAKRKRDKTKIQKTITAAKTELRRLG
jgi:hypothetical protein